MAKSLQEFLTNLGQDPKKREMYINDPEAVMTADGLAETDKELLRKGDVDGIKRALGSASGEPIMIIVCYRK